jgi:hypothetical protein
MNTFGRRNEELWRQRGPAHRVIEAFGGTRALARALEITPAAVTRWLYPRPAGAGGLIPSAQIMKILTAAAINGIVITDEMLAPRFERPLEELI